MKAAMKQFHSFAAACLMGLMAVLACSKEFAFPETEDAFGESVDLSVRIDSTARIIIEDAFAGGDDVNLKKLAKELGKIDGVVHTDVFADDDLIVLKQKDGVSINVFLDSFRESEGEEEFNPIPMDQASLSVQAWAPTRSEVDKDGIHSVFSGKEKVKGRALLLAPMYDEDLETFEKNWGEEGRQYGVTLYQSIQDYLSQSGYTVKPLLNRDASFATFDGYYMNGFDVVVMVSEGKKKAVVGPDCIQTNAIRTGSKVVPWDGASFREEYVPNLADDLTKLYYHFFERYSIGMIKGGLYYYLSAPVLQEDDEKYRDSWIMAGADYSASNDDLSNAFLKAHAGAFTGFDGDLDRMELLTLTGYMTAMMCTGLELDAANDLTKENARGIKGKKVSGRDKLVSHPRSEGDRFYLFDSTPFELHHEANDNKSFTLTWRLHPSIAERVCDVIVDDDRVLWGIASALPDQLYSVTYYPKHKGPHSWHVVSKIQSGGTVLAAFESPVDDFEADALSALEITPANWDFKPTPFGGELQSKEFVLQNIGENDIRIESFTFSDDVFSVYHEASDLLLEPKETMKVGVSFNPVVFGPHSDELLIKTDGDTYSVSLTAQCTYDGPTMRVEDGWGNPLSSLNFKDVLVGDEKTIDFGLANISPMWLEGSVSLSGSAFSLESWPDFSVESGWFARATVTFRPTEARVYSDVLRITLPDGLSSISFPIQGKGVSDTGSHGSAITLSPSVLHFNEVEIGKGKSLDFEIQNESDFPVRILGVDGPEGFFGGVYDGFWVGPHSSVPHGVTFKPEKERHYSGFVVVETDAGERIRSLFVDGSGVKPAHPKGALIAFDPDDIDFGEVLLGRCKVRTVQMTNYGDDDLHITSVVLADGIEMNMDLTGYDLPPGETCSFELKYTPTARQKEGGNLLFYSNARRDVEYIRFHGAGVTSTVLVESVSLNKTSLTMFKGEVADLTATVRPSNASDKYVTWWSSDPSVATVSSRGTVTACGYGPAVIVATTFDGHFRASCNIMVKNLTDGSHEGTGGESWD